MLLHFPMRYEDQTQVRPIDALVEGESVVVEGVVEPIAAEITRTIDCPTIGIGASAHCDGQVLVAEDMLGLFERTPRFVKRFADMAGLIGDAAAAYADEVRARSFPGPDQLYAPKP